MHKKSLTELHNALINKKLSSVELAELFIKRIYSNRHLNSFIQTNSDITIKYAKIADKKLASGKIGPLIGIPVAHKDVFVTREWNSTAGSNILKNYISPFNATIINKMQKAGMVCLGKTNMDEFAMGSSNENSAFGVVYSPWDIKAVPGGSSGGSAVAVAARLTPASTGTDTGGSIRQPSSFSGITGIKPTYGCISRYGIIAFASSLDQAGPMAKSAEDCAILLNAMSGFDKYDSTSINRKKEDYTRYIGKNWINTNFSKSKPLLNLKIGLPKEYFDSKLNNEVYKNIHNAIIEYEKLGAEIINISLPNTEISIPVYHIIAPAEASSNLSRFDGIRYGYRYEKSQNIIDMYKKTRSIGFGMEVKRRILIGTHILSQEHYSSYYLKAQKIRRIIAEDFQKAFNKCDIIMGPVSPVVSWDLKEKYVNPVQMYITDIYTISVNLAGLPGMSIPCGFGKYKSKKLRPIGLQIIGNYFNEARMLQVADAFQRITNWHNKTPGEY